MTKEELIRHIQDDATISDLAKIAHTLDVTLEHKDNINGLYFIIEDEYSSSYVKVLESSYNAKNDTYNINKCLYISEDSICIYDYDIEPIDLKENKELSKEEFEIKFNEVLAKILKASHGND